MKVYRIISAALLALCWHVAAVADGGVGWPDLRESYDPGLQSELEATLGQLGLQNAVDAEHLCVTLVDVTRLDEPRVATVNGDTMMYAASLPKIGILLGAFADIEAGRLKLDAANRESLTRMIRVSSNDDATRMLNLVGKNRINRILSSNRYRLYDPLVNGGLWVGKEYAKGVAFERDPLHNLSHGATAMQTARFYYMLVTGQLVNPQLTREMMTMLSDPGIKHKFVKGLAKRPGAKMFRKSGTWSHWHADSVLVSANGKRYILVALSDDARAGRWLANMAAPLHDLIVQTRVSRR